MTTTTTPALPTWSRWIGDSALATFVVWCVTIGLVFVDVDLLKPVVARVTQTDSDLLNWVATGGISGALAGVMGLSAEFMMRYIEDKSRGWLTGALALLATWIVAVGIMFYVRSHYYVAPIGGVEVASARSDGFFSALLLTVLVVLTGLVAAALAVVSHDELQKQRRKHARRRWWLSFMHRIATWREGVHARREQSWKQKDADITKRLGWHIEQVHAYAKRLKDVVRHQIMIALDDPAATSEIFKNRIERNDND